MVEIQKGRHPLLDLVQVAFILTDTHSKILYSNLYAERFFGYTGKEMEGKRIRLFFLEEDLTYFLPNIIYFTLYKSGFEGEALLKQKNGTKVFAYLHTTSFKEDGEVFMSFSFQEIQRLKTLERERVEMGHWASLGMMLEEIAHQIRNPIAAIGGYTRRLLKTLTPSPRAKSYLGQIFHETKRLETMMQRLEEYVLIPKPTYRKEKIQEIVESVLQTFSREATQKGISISLETGALEGRGDFFIDRNLLAKALFHILDNSIEAMTQKPTGRRNRAIKVSLFGDGGEIGLSISDGGEGISKKNLKRIFEPFFSTRPDRVGLGLTFAKRVVEEQEGSIRVESRLKKGTTTMVTFPVDRRRIVRREKISPRPIGKGAD